MRGEADAKTSTVEALDKLGRVRLSRHFFMRDMLHSQIAQVHGLLNAPDDPELAIAAGPRLCEELIYRRARLPTDENRTPHPRYLAWHREWHGIGA